jgi:hypothetical protein
MDQRTGHEFLRIIVKSNAKLMSEGVAVLNQIARCFSSQSKGFRASGLSNLLLEFPTTGTLSLSKSGFKSRNTVELSFSIRIYDRGSENLAKILVKVSWDICKGACANIG